MLSHAGATRALFAGLLIGCSTLSAGSITISFDAGDPIGGLAVGTILSNQYAATTGATFSPNAFTGAGGPTGSWATNTGLQIVSSTGGDVGGLGTPSLVSGNILRSFNDWLSENGDPSFAISFATPVLDFSATFAGIATSASTRIFAYNGTTLLTTVAAAAGGQQTLSISGFGDITSVVVTPGDFNDWVGVDNVSFTPDAGVPEPATLGMVGSAVLLFGISRVKRARS